MKIQIEYNDNIVPNDGYEYNETALIAEFRKRFKTAIRTEFPEAEIDFNWHSPSLRVFASSGDDEADLKTEEQIKRLLDSKPIWQGIEWDDFLMEDGAL